MAKISERWWMKNEKEVYSHIWDHIKHIETRNAHRMRRNRSYYRMYSGKSYVGLSGREYGIERSAYYGARLNLSNGACSYATSKIAKHKTRVETLVEGGPSSSAKYAKIHASAINGSFEIMKMYRKFQECFLNSTVHDFGLVRFWADHEEKTVKCENVPFAEMRVDDAEAIDGNPRMIHRVKQIPKYVAKEIWKDKANLIDQAPPSSHRGHEKMMLDTIDVAETTHIRSTKTSNDGMMCFSIQNGTLETREYNFDRHPYIKMLWNLPLIGWHGNSLCSIVQPIQEQIDLVIDKIHEHNKNHSGFIAIHEDSGVIDEHMMGNDVWKVIRYANQPPQYVYGPGIDGATIQYLNFLIQRGYEETGISMLSATSRKPGGLNSGKAIEEYNDIESERFQMTEQRYENAYVDAAWMITDLYDELFEKDKNLKIRYRDGSLLQSVPWSKIKMSRDDMQMRVVPTGFLPGTAAGKHSEVERMIQSGMLEKDEALDLLDYPDIEDLRASKNAPRKNVQRIIEMLLDPDVEDVDIPPISPFLNLGLAVKYGAEAYNRAEIEGADQELIERLARFVGECSEEIKKQQQKAMAEQMQAQQMQQQMQPQGPPQGQGPPQQQ